MLNSKKQRKLETHLVEMLLVLRSAFLSVQNGRPPMNYWEQFQTRMRAAARQTISISEWCSQMQRKLGIASLRRTQSRVLIELVRFCDENDAHLAALDMIERDHATIVALTQLTVEERKANANNAV